MKEINAANIMDFFGGTEITDESDLGIVAKSAPLHFFNADEVEYNEKLLNFWNERLNKYNTSNNKIVAKMIPLDPKLQKQITLQNKLIDNNMVSTEEAIQKGNRILIFTTEQETTDNVIGFIRDNQGKLKFVEVDTKNEYFSPLRAKERKDKHLFEEDAITGYGSRYYAAESLKIKGTSDVMEPYSNIKLKTNINDVSRINISNIGFDENGIQTSMNESYDAIARMIVKYRSTPETIPHITDYMNKSQRLTNKGFYGDILSASLVQTGLGTTNDTRTYNNNNEVIISGKNLIDSMHGLDSEVLEEIENKKYKDARFKIKVDENNRVIGLTMKQAGTEDYIQNKDLYYMLFKNNPYAGSYALERAKKVDADIKGIISSDQIKEFNKMIKYLNLDGGINEQELEETANEFRNSILNNFAIANNYKDYNQLYADIQNGTLNPEYFKSFLESYERIDAQTIMSRIENGYLFDNRLVNLKDKTTAVGYESILSAAYMEPLNYMNADSNRKHQIAQQLENANVNGVNVAKILDQNTNHIKELQNKKQEIRRLHAESISEIFSDKIYGTTSSIPDMNGNQISYLYGDFTNVFNDSSVLSIDSVAKNLADTGDSKEIFLDYASLNGKTLLSDLPEKYANLASLQDRLENFDLSQVEVEGSFEGYFLNKLLGEDNTRKFIRNYMYSDFIDEISKTKEFYKDIKSLKTEEEILQYGQANQEMNRAVNKAIRENMILSGSDAKLQVINPNMVKDFHTTSVSGATAGMIDNISFDSNGIRIKMKMMNIQNSGGKFMIDGSKGTQGNAYNAISAIVDNQRLIIDATINNKLSSAKRGMSGTIISNTLETMFKNTMTADFGRNMSATERLAMFTSMFKSNTIGANNSNILDLLNLSFGIDESGKLFIQDSNVSEALKKSGNNIFDVFSTLEGNIRESFRNNLEQKLGRKINSDDSAILHEYIINSLDESYQTVLNQMSEEERARNKVIIKDPVMNYVYQGSDGTQKIMKQQLQGTFYRFHGIMHQMDETKSRKTKDALKLSKISQIIAKANGNEEFINLVTEMAKDKNKYEIDLFAAVNDLNEDGTIANRELFDNIFKDAPLIDVSADDATISRFGVNDTMENLLKTPIGKSVVMGKDDDEKVMIKSLKGLISGFDDGLIEDLDNFFKNSDEISEDIARISFMSSIDEIMKKSGIKSEEFNLFKKVLNTINDNDNFYKQLLSLNNIYDITPFVVSQSSINSSVIEYIKSSIKNSNNVDEIKQKFSNYKKIVYNRFKFDNDRVYKQDYSFLHNEILDEIKLKLKIEDTKEFSDFNLNLNKLKLLTDEYKINKNDDYWSKISNILSNNFNIRVDNFENFNSRYSFALNTIESLEKDKINKFGFEAIIDTLRNTEFLNNDYYKFATSMDYMMSNLNGKQFDVNIFDKPDFLNFGNVSKAFLKSNLHTDNNILSSLINNVYDLTDGRIIHLNKLKQLSIYKQLPFFLTGVMSDANGRVVPSKSLADLLGVINGGIGRNSDYQLSKELDKIQLTHFTSIDSVTKKMIYPNTKNKNFNTLARRILLVNEGFYGYEDMAQILRSDIDFRNIYKINRYQFYKSAAELYEPSGMYSLKHFEHDDITTYLGSEIKKKFADFRKMIQNSDTNISNSIGIFLKDLGVKDIEFANKVGNYLNDDKITVKNLINFVYDAKNVLYSSNNKKNSASFSVLNNTVNEIEKYLDEMVQQGVFPLLDELQSTFQYVANNEMTEDEVLDVVNKIKHDKRFRGLFKPKPIKEEQDHAVSAIDDVFGGLFNFILGKKEKQKSSLNILSRILSLSESSMQGYFGKGNKIAEAGTFIAKNSARFSPRDASNAHLIAVNAIRNSLDNFTDIATLEEEFKKIRIYTGTIFGKDVDYELNKKLALFKVQKKYTEEDLLELTNYLGSKQNIIIGTEQMYKTAGFLPEFSNNYYSYGFLHRDPAQFTGSFTANRFVKIDFSKDVFKNNDLFRQLFGNMDVIDNTANLIMVGRSSAINLNGDFDGDVMSAFVMGTRNQKLIDQYKAGKGEYFNDLFHLQNLIANSSQDNLIEDFSKDKLKNATQHDIRQLVIKLHHNSGLNDNSSNAEVFEKIKKYYLKTIYYQHSVQAKLEDELAKHADTQLIGKKIMGVSTYALSDFGLNLTAEERILTKRTDFNLDAFQKLLDSKTGVLKENTLQEFANHSTDELFSAFNELISSSKKLGINNLFGEVNKIEDMLSIGRAGIMHDSYTGYRAFSTMFENEPTKKLFLQKYADLIDEYYPDDTKNHFLKLIDEIGESNADNIFGDLIESGSIGGKHGASSSPFEVLEDLKKIANITRNRKIRSTYLTLDEANKTIDALIESVKTADNKIIVDKTIGEYVTGMFAGADQISETTLNTTIDELTLQLGKMLGVERNAKNVKFADIEGLSASDLAGTLHIFDVAAAKGHVEKVTNTDDIIKGSVNKIKTKKSIGAQAKELFDSFRKKPTVDDKTTTKGHFSEDLIHAGDILKDSVTNAGDAIGETAELREKAEAEARVARQRINAENINLKNIVDDATKNADTEDPTDGLKRTIEALKKVISDLQKQSEGDSKYINELTQKIASMENQLKKAAESEAPQGVKKTGTKIVEETANIAKKAKDDVLKHRTGLTIAGAALILGSFFKIFQSNRPVVNLDINDRQYEQSKGSIYRDLNRYTINTNIRELY